MFEDLPGTDGMSNSRSAINTGNPINAEVVRQLTKVILEGQKLTPSKDIAIGIEVMLSRGSPRANEYLEHGIVPVQRNVRKEVFMRLPVQSQEVVDRCLRVRKHLHSLIPLCVVHQVETPEIIVDLHDVVVATSEIWDDIVQ